MERIAALRRTNISCWAEFIPSLLKNLFKIFKRLNSDYFPIQNLEKILSNRSSEKFLPRTSSI
jgi:hypothetical protein